MLLERANSVQGTGQGVVRLQLRDDVLRDVPIDDELGRKLVQRGDCDCWPWFCRIIMWATRNTRAD
jgi:hypothetical protein